MKKISVVIGGLWGDEGKGHMTDILSAKLEDTLTVRFNGGCQASHTVVTPDGKKYAFRHIGAGSFTGADTYLSEDFIVNPVFYSKESRSLFPIIPFESHDTYVNPNCLVTTYWDIYINQVVEVMRGKKKHGSRGLGINETIERSKYPEYKLTVMDLVDRNLLYFKLKRIEKYYVPQRLKEYGITISQMPLEYKTLFIEDDIVEMFMFYTDSFLSNVKIASDDIINRYYNHIVFEGALGLLLDQDSQFKPHVTHSNTGIKNVMTIFNKLKIEEKPDIYYMCRCYATKHGAGYFPGECSIDDYVNVVDETNVTNEFQGDLRFGILNLDLLAEAINKDLANLTVDANINICITCMDQVPGDIKYVINDVCITATKEEFLKEFKTFMKEKLTQFDRLYITDGLTRENYHEV